MATEKQTPDEFISDAIKEIVSWFKPAEDDNRKKCDHGDDHVATGAVAGPRPSDPTEIVAVMWGCEAHMGEPADLSEYDGGMVFATWEAWENYIESPLAAKNGHMFLTI